MATYQDAILRYAAEDAYQGNKGFDPASVLYYPAAVVTDIFTSVANSFIWGEENELQTGELLGDIVGQDAATFYERNRTAVNVGSLVAGSFLPGKAVSSIASLSRSGKLLGIPLKAIHGATFFNNKLAASKVGALQALATAGATSAEYHKAVRGMKLWRLATGAAEATVMEAEVLALYNGHDFFDEYDAGDFFTNLGIGTALGVGLKSIINNKEFRAAAQQVQADKLKPLTKYIAMPRFLGNQGLNVAAEATQLQALRTKLLDTSLDVDSRAILESSEVSLAQRVRTNLLRMMSPELRGASETKRLKTEPLADFLQPGASPDPTPLESLGQLLSKDPGAMIGVGHKFSGNPKPPIRQFTINSILGMDPEFETGIKVLEPGKIQSTSMGKFVKALLGKNTALLTPENMLEIESKVKGLPDFSLTATSADSLEVVLKDFNPDSRLHRAYIATKLSQVQQDLGATITMPQAKELERAIKWGRQDPEAMAKLNGQISSKALTLDELDELGIDFGDSRAVLYTWNGRPELLSHKEARLLAGASENPEFLYDPKYSFNVAGRRSFDPTRNSVMRSEEEFLNSYYHTRGLNLDQQSTFLLGEQDLPRLQALYLKAAGNKTWASKINATYVDPTTGKDLKSIVGLDGLKGEIIEAKIKWAKQAIQERGLSVEQVARATNTPTDTIKLFVESEYKFSPDFMHMLDSDIMRFTKLDDAYLETQLKPKMLTLDGDVPFMAKRQEMAARIGLDAEHLDTIQSALAENLVATGGSKIAGTLYDEVVKSPLMRGLADEIEQLGTTESISKGFFTSADFTLRNNPLGAAVIKLGSDIRAKVQASAEEVIGTIRPAIIKLGQNPAQRTKFYMIKQSLDSLSSNEAQFLKPVTVAEAGQQLRKIEIAPAQLDNAGRVVKPASYLKYLNSGDEVIWKIDDEIDGAMNAILGAQTEMLNMLNINRKLRGMEPIPGRGIWMPAQSIDDQFTAYLIKRAPFEAPDVKLIVGRDLNDFEAKIAQVQSTIDHNQFRIVRSRDQLADWNEIHSFAKLENLERANPAATKSGIVAEQIPSDNSLLDDLLSGYNEYIWTHSRMFMENAEPRLFSKLNEMAYAQQTPATSTTQNIFTRLQKRPNTAEFVARTLLNKSHLPSSPIFNSLNNAYSAMITMASRGTTEAINDLAERVKGREPQLAEFSKLADDLRAIDAPMPWASIVEYQRANNPRFRDLSQEHIAKASSLLVTLNLRLWEVSHAIVNTLSAPIMMMSETGQGPFASMKFMQQGTKMVMKPSAQEAALLARWKAAGYTTRQTAEVTELFRDLHIRIPTMDKLEQTKLWQWMTKPSDWSEATTREVAFATGFKLAKAKFPAASVDALEAYALQFTNRSMGNYLSKQRPTLFQGSLGATLGLYQTFMLTMTQNIFRHIESKDLKALATLGIGWQGMFGTGALPLYGPINHAIGKMAETPGDDITSAIYEMFGDTSDQSRSLAEFVMYGLPSAAFQVPLASRAELEPRLPLSAEQGVLGLSPALLNSAYDAVRVGLETGQKLASIIGAQGNPKDYGRAIFEGLSAQYLWRPGARIAELALGRSLDRTGATVSTSQEIYEPWAVLARVMGSRPLKEQTLRTLRYQSRYYDAIGRERRRQTVKAMRSMVVDGTSGNSVARLMNDYIANGGTVKGFNQAMQQAYMGVNQEFADKLLEDADNIGPINEIISSYAF